MVTAVPVTIEGKTQNIVSVIFGAEGTAERYEKSTMLIEYAKQYTFSKGWKFNLCLSCKCSQFLLIVLQQIGCQFENSTMLQKMR